MAKDNLGDSYSFVIDQDQYRSEPMQPPIQFQKAFSTMLVLDLEDDLEPVPPAPDNWISKSLK